MTDTAIPGALEQFRAAVRGDAALQAALQDCHDFGAFPALVLRLAQERGIALDAADVANALKPDPAGIARFMDPLSASPELPPAGWLPIGIDAELAVDWLFFGARPLAEPFFEDSMRRARMLPYNRLIRYRTSLARLGEWAAHNPGLAPAGLIFHMSRCGSTLVAQMLAAVQTNVVVSEAAGIDAVVQFDRAGRADPQSCATLLAQLTVALGQKRNGHETRYFIKLDSWHTLALPLFRRAFPTVPWVFLYRDPVEVLASQLMQRGMQTVPHYLPPSHFGIDSAENVSPEDYCALVLRRTCEAVIEHHAQGGGLLINYRDLPEAVAAQILPHFGVTPTPGERATMTARTAFDAKTPMLSFSAEDDRRQKAAIAKAHSAGKLLDAVYGQLERLRTGAAAT
ncbi:MAG TPA: sulfotransferase [Rhizomicrobium sp.]|jgi:hypothetical protein|nr:sulfotransferase [Rhizomicrobium sp.]